MRLVFPLPEELPLDQHLLKWLDVLGFNKDYEGVGIRGLEMAQPVKYVSHKHKDASPVLSTYVKGEHDGTHVLTSNPSSGTVKTGGPPGLAGHSLRANQ